MVKEFKGVRVASVLPLTYDNTLSVLEFLAKVQNKLNEVIDTVNNISVDILGQANAYTDAKVAEALMSVNEAVEEVYSVRNELLEQYNEFTNLTNAQLQIFNARLRAVDARIDDVIISVNEYTDLAIEQNNDFIYQNLAKELANVKVLNYFTGAYVSVQEMFDYLAQFHLENAITYAQLASRDKTYDELIALNITYTELATQGGNYIL